MIPSSKSVDRRRPSAGSARAPKEVALPAGRPPHCNEQWRTIAEAARALSRRGHPSPPRHVVGWWLALARLQLLRLEGPPGSTSPRPAPTHPARRRGNTPRDGDGRRRYDALAPDPGRRAGAGTRRTQKGDRIRRPVPCWRARTQLARGISYCSPRRMPALPWCHAVHTSSPASTRDASCPLYVPAPVHRCC